MSAEQSSQPGVTGTPQKTYTATECFFIGLAVLLLLNCIVNLFSSESFNVKANIPGLNLSSRAGYTPKPNYNLLDRRDSFHVGQNSANMGHLSVLSGVNGYGGKVSQTPPYHLHANVLNDRLLSEDVMRNETLHEISTRETPASAVFSTPSVANSESLWWTDGTIPEATYNNDAAESRNDTGNRQLVDFAMSRSPLVLNRPNPSRLQYDV